MGRWLHVRTYAERMLCIVCGGALSRACGWVTEVAKRWSGNLALDGAMMVRLEGMLMVGVRAAELFW